MNTWSSILLSYLTKKYPSTEENIRNTKVLTLDNHIIGEISKEIKDYIQVFKNVEKLNLISCKLYSLNNLPELPNLIKIELDDNNLTEKEIIKLKEYPKLSEIYVINNNIASFEELKQLSNMRELHLLDFSDNPISQIKDYREKMFAIFPRLLYLDGLGKNNEKYEELEEENEEENEDEEEEEDEDDKNFIENDLKKRKNNNDNIFDSEDEESEEEDEENGEYEIPEEEEEEEEIENPNPAKKKKTK